VYSNTGDFLAEDVVITDTLPLSVTVVYSTPAAYMPNSHALVWTISDLSASSGPRTATVVAVVDSELTGGSCLTNTATIASRNANSVTEQVTTKARFLVYLPVIFRNYDLD
jgi:hypothetical protein